MRKLALIILAILPSVSGIAQLALGSIPVNLSNGQLVPDHSLSGYFPSQAKDSSVRRVIITEPWTSAPAPLAEWTFNRHGDIEKSSAHRPTRSQTYHSSYRKGRLRTLRYSQFWQPVGTARKRLFRSKVRFVHGDSGWLRSTFTQWPKYDVLMGRPNFLQRRKVVCLRYLQRYSFPNRGYSWTETMIPRPGIGSTGTFAMYDESGLLRYELEAGAATLAYPATPAYLPINALVCYLTDSIVNRIYLSTYPLQQQPVVRSDTAFKAAILRLFGHKEHDSSMIVRVLTIPVFNTWRQLTALHRLLYPGDPNPRFMPRKDSFLYDAEHRLVEWRMESSTGYFDFPEKMLPPFIDTFPTRKIQRMTYDTKGRVIVVETEFVRMEGRYTKADFLRASTHHDLSYDPAGRVASVSSSCRLFNADGSTNRRPVVMHTSRLELAYEEFRFRRRPHPKFAP